MIAANKIDLFPKDVSKHRLTSWIYDAIKDHCGFISPKESERDIKRELQEHGWFREGVKEVGVLKRSNVHLVSCNSGVGMDGLLMNLMELASLNGNRVCNLLYLFIFLCFYASNCRSANNAKFDVMSQ